MKEKMKKEGRQKNLNDEKEKRKKIKVDEVTWKREKEIKGKEKYVENDAK